MAMPLPFEDSATVDLRNRAATVSAILQAAFPGVVESCFSQSPNGPSAEFHVPVRTSLAPKLAVSLFEDSSHLILGPCEAIIELVGNDLQRFGEFTTTLLTDILAGPLCVQVRRGLFGGLTGAFVITDRNGRTYKNGELFAMWFGRTQRYENWRGES